MEALKQVLAVLAAIVGAVTAILTLYAKYLDVQKAVRERSATGSAAEPLKAGVVEEMARPVEPALVPTLAPERSAAVPSDPGARTRALEVVKAPALALMIAGGLSLFANLFLGGFGYVDEFVTPLTAETRIRKDLERAWINNPEGVPPQYGLAGQDPNRTNAMLGFITLLSFSIPSAMSVWAGFEMLRLRSYWVSVAGSLAIMPGACVCCLGGFPVGVWSLTVLFRPDIAAAFR